MLEDLPTDKRRTHRYTLPDLLQFDFQTDGILLSFILIIFIILTFTTSSSSRSDSIVCLNGAWHNTLMSHLIFGDRIPSMTSYYRQHHYSLSNVFPLYPILLGVFEKLFFGHIVAAARFLSLTLSGLSALIFYRLCLTLRVVTSPFLTACIFTVFPIRSIFLRMIANEHNIVVILISMVYLGRRIRHKLVFGISLFLLILSSESGLLISLVIVLDSAITRNRSDFKSAIIPTAAGVFALIGFHTNFAGSPFAFLRDVRNLKQFPFKQMLQDAMSISELRHFHGMYGFYVVPIIAGTILTTLDRTIGLPIMIALIWAAGRPGAPTFDCATPLETFAVLLGVDMLIASQKFKTALWGLGPVYVCGALYVVSLYLRNSAMLNQWR